jgi:ribonuclease P protein component
MEQLKRRADFLAAASALRVPAPAFLLQGRDRKDERAARIGYTVTKKTGTAVERNRIRRRLRAAAKDVVPGAGRDGFDYVLVARRTAISEPFDKLKHEMERALTRLHSGRAQAARAGGRDGR